MLNGAFLGTVVYSLFYIALEPFAGFTWSLFTGVPCWLTATAFAQHVPNAWAWAIAVHALSWYAQIHVGHIVLEHRKPALLDSFFQVRLCSLLPHAKETSPVMHKHAPTCCLYKMPAMYAYRICRAVCLQQCTCLQAHACAAAPLGKAKPVPVMYASMHEQACMSKHALAVMGTLPCQWMLSAVVHCCPYLTYKFQGCVCHCLLSYKGCTRTSSKMLQLRFSSLPSCCAESGAGKSVCVARDAVLLWLPKRLA